MLAALLSQVLVPAADTGGDQLQTGTFILGIDAGVFRDPMHVRRGTAHAIEQVKSVPPAAGFSEVMAPGEPEIQMAERRRRDGIPIPEDTWNEIQLTARSLGMTISRTEF